MYSSFCVIYFGAKYLDIYIYTQTHRYIYVCIYIHTYINSLRAEPSHVLVVWCYVLRREVLGLVQLQKLDQFHELRNQHLGISKAGLTRVVIAKLHIRIVSNRNNSNGNHSNRVLFLDRHWTLQAVTDAHGVDAHGVGANSAQPHGLG